MKTQFYAEAHIPRGSGDAEWRIVTEDGTIVAIVDPEMAMDNPSKVADAIVAAMNVDPEAIL